MRQLLTIFFRSPHANPWTVLTALSFAAIAEGLSLSTFVPIFSIVLDSDAGNSTAYRAIAEMLGLVGLEMDLVNLLLLAVVAIGLKGVLTVFAMRHVGDAVAKVSTGSRLKLLRDLLAARWAYFVEQPLGRFVNAVSGDATRAGRTYMEFAIALTHALRALVLIIVAFTVSWTVALFALAAGGMIALVLHWLVRMAKRAGDRQTRHTAELVIGLSDALNNMKPLKAMHRHESIARLFDKGIEALRRALRKQVVAAEGFRSAQEFLMLLCLAGGVVLATGVFRIEPASMLVMGIVLLQTVNAIGKVQAYYQKAAIFVSANRFVDDLIRDTERAREQHHGSESPTLEQGLSLSGIDFGYGGMKVLDGLELHVGKGEMVAITGASGAGKTTVIDLVLGLHRPERGVVAIDGVPLERLDIGRWREMVGYVSQELSLFHDTIRANVTLGDPNISDAEVEAALRAAGAWSHVERLPAGLDTEVGEKGTRLSGGQRQRIALARALVFRPKLLLLDEVTSALDTEAEAELCRTIDGLRGRLTIIAVTHRPALRDLADRVFALQDGRLIEAGARRPAVRASSA